MHPLLARQLRRQRLDSERPPADSQAWTTLLESVAKAYKEADEARYLLERSLSLSSREMQELARTLRERETHLQRDHERLKELVTHAPVAIAMFDSALCYLAHSAQWASEYALPGELIGRSHYELLPDQPQSWRTLHARALSGEIVQAAEDVFQRECGQSMHLRWAAQPWHRSDGTVGGIMIVSSRIDDLVQARELALEGARLKAEFLANMSHELRTPIHGVLGMGDLLLETSLDDGQADYVQTIVRSADALLSLINDILDFSKIEAGKLDLEQVEFDPRATVNDVLALLAESAQRKGLVLAGLTRPEVPALLVGDPGRLRQVVTNLVGNAIKFTDNGEVLVTLDLRDRQGDLCELDLTVADTGIGIDPSQSARLFEAFHQADGSTTRRFGGTGLGLAISKQLVELMGGSITVESQLGRGSAFHVLLRLSAPAPVRLQQGPTLRRFDGRRMLLVDPNRTYRRVAREQACARGFEVAEASDADQALTLLVDAARSGKPFDVALVDCSTPGKGALQLAEEARVCGELRGLRLVLTALLIERSRLPDVSLQNFDALMTKPLRDSALFKCLGRLLMDCGEEPPPALPARGIAGADSAQVQGRNQLRVLLVEDNPVNRRVALAMLERLGYRVDVAENGREAVGALGVRAYAAVLMDCQMPVQDGFSATKEIRAREAGHGRVPIIAMTAFSMAGDRERCLAAGMDDHIAKPFKVKDLKAALDHWTRATA